MYIDGHKRVDIVAYWQAFAYQWAGYKLHFQFWDDNGNPLPCLTNSHCLILVTHDESTFYQNDEWKTCWNHQDRQPCPKPKGDRQSLMVSDFLTSEWGCLHDGNKCTFLFYILFHSLLISLQRGPHRFQTRKELWRIFQCATTYCPSWSCNWYLRGQGKWPCPGLVHVWQCFQPPEACFWCHLCNQDGQKCVQLNCFFFVLSMFLEIPSISGCTTWMGHGCAMASTLWQVSHNHFTSQMTTPIIQGGSRVWDKSFTSVAFGPMLASLSTVLASILRDRLLVAAATSSIPSMISQCRSCCSKSISNHIVIYVTTIQSITASSTSLSGTGVWWSISFALLAGQGLLGRWKRRCWHVSIMSPLNKFKGMFPLLFLFQDWNLFADLQTGPHALFSCIVTVCPAYKQHGPTRNTMAIAFSL